MTASGATAKRRGNLLPSTGGGSGVRFPALPTSPIKTLAGGWQPLPTATEDRLPRLQRMREAVTRFNSAASEQPPEGGVPLPGGKEAPLHDAIARMQGRAEKLALVLASDTGSRFQFAQQSTRATAGTGDLSPTKWLEELESL